MNVAIEYDSLVDTEEALEGMLRRLCDLLGSPVLDQDAFVEIAAIFNNVAYIFLYLESNEAHIDYQRLLPWRDRFHKDPALDARLIDRLTVLRCPDRDAEESRHAFIQHLRAKLDTPDAAAEAARERLQADAKAVLADTQQQHQAFLARLGVPPGAKRSAAAFYKMVANVDDPATRTKLSRAWEKVRDRNLAALTGIIDAMVEARRRDADRYGRPSVLAGTLTRCRVDEATAADYLYGYLTRALDSHARLSEEIHGALGTAGNAMDHFGRYVRTLQGDTRVPTFDLDECLAYLFLVAERTFGLVLARRPESSGRVITVDAEFDGRSYGRITFDLWDRGATLRTANTTRGIRNRTDWTGLAQHPVAYVACRFQRGGDGLSRINFQNMHSLCHEFGHAVNHLLIRKRLPTQSGLEYLPLERLENLSMWFEKWVYHPDLAGRLSLSDDDAAGLALAQRIKMLEYRRTHVDRAVTAALDFELHRRRTGGLRESFAELDKRFGVSEYCSLGDFPVYFTWPMFQANPGANFAYLWGAADSAARFVPFLAGRIEDAPPPERTYDMFASCFDYDEPSAVPDSGSVFRFYDALLPTSSRGAP